jgi:hypothetical protein
MIAQIKTAIIGLLQSLTDLKAIYAYPEPDAKAGFPYAIVTWDRNQSDVITNQQDRVALTFRVRCIQEKMENHKGREAAEITSDDRVAKIEALYRDNNDLGLSNVLRVLPMESTKTYDSGGTRIITETLVKVEVLANVKI